MVYDKQLSIFPQRYSMDLLRYNSLPRLADWIIDYPSEYYRSVGVDPYYDKSPGIDIDKIKSYDTVFVKIDLLDQIVPHLDQISCPWHLITGNGDLDVTPQTLEYLCQNSSLKTWCGHNLPKINDKFLQIPIGFQELGPGRPNSPVGPFVVPESKPIPVVVTPFGQTHGSRNALLELSGPGILNLQTRLLYSDYLMTLSASKYSCCPRGNGWDTHRVLESIALGAVPVVLHSPLDFMYQQLGCVIIDDWKQCVDYQNFPKTTIVSDTIEFSWWQSQVKKHQETIR